MSLDTTPVRSEVEVEVGHNLDPREMALEGIVNFRDIGGLQTRDGGVVRTGRIFRSDALHTLTAVDIDRLAGLHIATLIDLRTLDEIARSGPSPLTRGGTRVVHAPVMDVDASPRMLEDKPLAEMYADFLLVGKGAFRTIFEAIDEQDELPAVIHCAAGKDRTGVTIALLLRVLGVPDETIVADYAITDRNMARMIEGWKRSNPRPAAEEEATRIPEQLIRATPGTMEAFLVALDATHGSAEGYLRSVGVTNDQLDRLRGNLLV